MYPGGGLIATSEVARDETWNNPIAVRVPDGVYAPQTLDVYMGLYHPPTGDRMVPAGSGIEPTTDRVLLGQVELARRRARCQTPSGRISRGG